MIHAVADHIWQSTLVTAAVVVLCFLLRADRAAIRYWLWLAASIKFLVPFSLLKTAGAWFAGATALSTVSLDAFSVVTIVAQPFAEVRPLVQPVGFLFAVWMAGAAFLLLRWWVYAMQLRRVLASADFSPAALSCDGRPVSVYRTPAGIEPGVVGWWRPALLLPAGIEQRISSARFAAIVEHELHHIRRRDNLTANLQMLVEIVFWFYPVVWWIGSRLIDERERACDEMVVASGHDRKTYASSILDVCASYVASPLRSVIGISGSDLNRRITRIMRGEDMSRLGLLKKLLLSYAGLAALAIPFIAGLQQAAQAQEDDVLPPLGSESRLPVEALASGRYVIVGYTPSADGSVIRVEVIDSSSPEFEMPTMDSVRRYEYVDRVMAGAPVHLSPSNTRFEFVLTEGNENQSAGDLEETLIETGNPDRAQ